MPFGATPNVGSRLWDEAFRGGENPCGNLEDWVRGLSLSVYSDPIPWVACDNNQLVHRWGYCSLGRDPNTRGWQIRGSSTPQGRRCSTAPPGSWGGTWSSAAGIRKP